MAGVMGFLTFEEIKQMNMKGYEGPMLLDMSTKKQYGRETGEFQFLNI